MVPVPPVFRPWSRKTPYARASGALEPVQSFRGSPHGTACVFVRPRLCETSGVTNVEREARSPAPAAEAQTDGPAQASTTSTRREPQAPPPRKDLAVEESVSAIFASVHREGRWEPADEIHIRAIFGAVHLDFSHAEIPPRGIVEIDVQATFGSVEIVVPPEAEIELAATPVMGSVEQKVRKGSKLVGKISMPSTDDEPGPVFQIRGVALFGSIEVRGG